MIGRETLITVAQQVFDTEKHPIADGIEPSNTDTKRMMDAYLDIELAKESARAKSFAKSAVALCNQLTHDRSATKRDAALRIVSVIAVASMIRAINEG